MLRLEGDLGYVATGKSPNGKPVEIEWVQNARNRLVDEGELEISVESVGYRSAFIGAVLATLPGTITSTHPRMVRLGRGGE